MKKPNHYSAYRGSSTITKVLKAIALLLLLVVIVGGLAFLLMGRFMSVSSTGIRFSFPWSQEAAATPAPSQTVEIVLPSATPTPTPTPTPPPDPTTFVTLTIDDLLAGNLPTLADNQGLQIEMKPVSGQLPYVTDVPWELWLTASGDDPAVNEAIATLLEGDTYTVAYFSCFRDNLAPYLNNNLALRTSWGNFWDDQDTRWLNPNSEHVPPYLLALATEVAEMGFDAMVFDNWNYPTRGYPENITTPMPSETIPQFQADMEEALPNIKIIWQAPQKNLSS